MIAVGVRSIPAKPSTIFNAAPAHGGWRRRLPRQDALPYTPSQRHLLREGCATPRIDKAHSHSQAPLGGVLSPSGGDAAKKANLVRHRHAKMSK